VDALGLKKYIKRINKEKNKQIHKIAFIFLSFDLSIDPSYIFKRFRDVID